MAGHWSQTSWMTPGTEMDGWAGVATARLCRWCAVSGGVSDGVSILAGNLGDDGACISCARALTDMKRRHWTIPGSWRERMGAEGQGRCLQDSSCDIAVVVGAVWTQYLPQGGKDEVGQRLSARHSTDCRSWEEPRGHRCGETAAFAPRCRSLISTARRTYPATWAGPEVHIPMTRAARSIKSPVVRVGTVGRLV